MERKLEILAPAGSFESLKAAVAAGADAVYMGGSRFGARAYAKNPEGDLLLEAIDYAHLYGVKLYLTVNTLLKEQELSKELYEYLLPCYEHGLDAVIVQDLGVVQAVREWFPGLPVHASTQMTLCGAGSVKLLKEAGVRRVVLSRELSLPEIAKIHEETGMELECFVHGALCYSYSGQCLFSSILGGRSGNRGRCAQPCRLAYDAGSAVKQTLLSPKDICAVGLIPKIAEAGVYSLKIEGRMKRPEYTAGVVRIYRKYADQYERNGAKGYRVSEADLKELMLLFNRDGFSEGYYEQHNGRNMMALSERRPSDREKREYEELIRRLRVEYVEREKKIPVRGRLYAEAGKPMKLTLEEAETPMRPAPGEAGEPMRAASGEAGEQGRADGLALTVYGACPQAAQNRPVEAEQLEKQLRKTGNTPFLWTELEIWMDGSLFVPIQAVNSLRREAFDRMKEARIRACFRTVLPASEVRAAGRKDPGEQSRSGPAAPSSREDEGTGRPALHVSVETEEQLLGTLAASERLKKTEEAPLTAVYVDAEGMEESLEGAVSRIRGSGLEAYIMLPAVFRRKTEERYEKKKAYWAALPADGYVIRNLEEYEYIRRMGWKKKLILDHNVYTFNHKSCSYWQEQGVRMQTNPLELNSREIQALSVGERIQVIYGRYPMMVTAGCLRRTLRRCRHQSGILFLKDRYRKEFPVKNYCRDCYNIIYNSQPLCLLDQTEALEPLKATAYRIMLTTESGRETVQVLECWMEHRKPPTDFTRGHFKRGVE